MLALRRINKILLNQLFETPRNYLSVYRTRCARRKLIKTIRRKNEIKVVFLLIHQSVWKCDELYRLMEAHPRFAPQIIICPDIIFGEEHMHAEMNTAYNYFSSRRYSVRKSYDENTHCWLNIQKSVNPDIIFFTNPHNITRREYCIHSYVDKLTCYVPYGFMIANLQQSQFNQDFHNHIWRCYYETSIHKQMAEKYARNNGVNVVVSGSPMCDRFLDSSYSATDVWKKLESKVPRIIWAPHHSIEECDMFLGYSNFLRDHQLMINLAIQFQSRLQFALKPHPLLKSKLYNHCDWGKTRTDNYFEIWDQLPNCQLEEGPYEDLFLTSDALIFDSVSFISEYVFTKKPSLFVVRDPTIKNKFNEYGMMAFDLIYKSNSEAETVNFINNVVLGGCDPRQSERIDFLEKYLLPPIMKSASLTILKDLEIQIS